MRDICFNISSSDQCVVCDHVLVYFALVNCSIEVEKNYT